MRALMWFRADLRIQDNSALFYASRECRDGVVACFTATPETWQAHDKSACQVDMILRQLVEVKAACEKLNIPFVFLKLKRFDDCPEALFKLMQKHHIEKLYFNKQYEFDERKRDEAVEACMAENGLSVKSYDDQIIAPPGKILTPKLKPYTVFTPFKKAWLSWIPRHGLIHPIDKPEKQPEAICEGNAIPKTIEGFKSDIDPDLWPVGEAHAHKQLQTFIKQHLKDYESIRDFPAIEGTSKLSPYLAIGILSPRQCLDLALKADTVKKKDHVNAWINELIWREFYKHISFHFPRVCKGFAFQEAYSDFKWDNKPSLRKAWEAGETGFPLVDAAMRQLNQTGWMHNRLRMLTAMFFTKLMYQDWHHGERYFMEHLIDGDFSANNGGWQWSASTGTDAAPYFRIFNPWTQSENFDPDGEFIRQYCPELKDFDAKAIHNPHAHDPELAKKVGYPKPIIDYKAARERTIADFKAFGKKK